MESQTLPFLTSIIPITIILLWLTMSCLYWLLVTTTSSDWLPFPSDLMQPDMDKDVGQRWTRS